MTSNPELPLIVIARSNATKQSSSNPDGSNWIATSCFALLAMTNKTYWVYILASRRNGTLYIGVTSDLKIRIWQHKNGRLAGFTSRYGVNTLVYLEDFRDISNAITREKQLKAGSRAKKIELIERANPDWRDLSDGWFD